MTRARLYTTAAAAAAISTFAASTPSFAVDINDLFVFGDSYSDTGAYVELSNGRNRSWIFGAGLRDYADDFQEP